MAVLTLIPKFYYSDEL